MKIATFRNGIGAVLALLLPVLSPAAAQWRAEEGAETRDPIPEYRIVINDTVTVTVFGEPTLSGTFPIDSAGMIALRLIGNVPAAGLTIAELNTEIRKKYAAGYLVNPKINVEMANFSPFFIAGEINSPGEYAYTNGLTVLNAIIKAKGFTYRANKKRVFLKRIDEDTEHLVPYSRMNTTLVRPGDTIRVAERFF